MISKINNNIYLKFILIYVVLIIFFILFLYGSTFVPQKNVSKNVYISYNYYAFNERIGYLNNTTLYKDQYYVDYADDAKGISMAYLINPNKRLSSIIEMNYFSRIEYGPGDYTRLMEGGDTDPKIVQYSRYWHGQVAYLRYLFNFTHIRNIYNINKVVIVALIIILNIILFKKSKILLLLMDLSFIIVNFFIVPFCMEYFMVFSLALILSIIATRIYNNEKKLETLFIISGMVTCFFDFLTCETVALTLPLFITVFLRIKDKKDINFKEIIKYMVLWGLGYILTFALKWLIDCIHFGFKFFKEIFKQMGVRVYEKNTNYFFVVGSTYVKTLTYLFPLSYIKYNLSIGTFILLVCMYFYLFDLPYKTKSNINKLGIIALVPIARILVLSSHSYFHAFFTYRSLIPIIMLVLLIYISRFYHNVFK